MQTISLHRQISKQAKQQACVSAYWSLFSNSLGNDRTPEIITGFREGAGYA